MEVVEDKILVLNVTKNNKLKNGYYVPSKIGKSADGFITLSMEFADGTIQVIRLGEIVKLARKSGYLI